MDDPRVTTERRKTPRGALPSRFLTFTRAEWAPLRANTPLTLSDDDLAALRGLNDVLSMEDVVEIYLPLSRLLSLYVQGTRTLHGATSTFLGDRSAKTPFIIGLAGSVAVGKSTTARILQALLSRWPDHPRVDLLTTDGFLLPNRVLEERGLMQRKGFPESYDRGRLVRFLADVKSGAEEVTAPVYSHVRYDIIPGAEQTVRHPDVVIVEGLNVLQAPPAVGAEMQLFASDFFDFSILDSAMRSPLFLVSLESVDWFPNRRSKSVTVSPINRDTNPAVRWIPLSTGRRRSKPAGRGPSRPGADAEACTSGGSVRDAGAARPAAGAPSGRGAPAP